MKTIGAILIVLISLAAVLMPAAGPAPSPAKPIDVTFAEKTSEFTWPLAEIDPSLPADWSDPGFLVLEMRTSHTERMGHNSVSPILSGNNRLRWDHRGARPAIQM